MIVSSIPNTKPRNKTPPAPQMTISPYETQKAAKVAEEKSLIGVEDAINDIINERKKTHAD